MARRKTLDFLGFLDEAHSPQVKHAKVPVIEEKARSPHEALDDEIGAFPKFVKPKGPVQKGAFKRVHR